MSPDRIAGLALVACAALLALPSILVRALTWIEVRRSPKRTVLPLPKPTDPEDAFYAWVIESIVNTPAHPFARTAREIRSLPEVSA